jgi:hypothetical protein
MDLYEEFVGLIDLLERDRVDYAVCGGIAVAIHGYPRFTKDIDLVVHAVDVTKVKTLVASRGFVLPAAPMRFDRGTEKEREVHRVSKVEGDNLLTLDLLVMGAGLDTVWNDRDAFEWNGRIVRVVSRAGLISMKRASGRDQDRLDIQQLEKIR